MAPEPSVICLDAMGVIYRIGDDMRDLLIPFARERGSTRSDGEISAEYHACSRGEFSSAELWRRLGVQDPESEHERAYLSRYQLMPGITQLVRRWVARGLTVACLSNDISEWSAWLRMRHALASLISPWIVSGDVGVRKPDERIYRALLEALDIDADRCVFVDDRERNLDAARTLGLRTILFGAPSAAHPFALDVAGLDAMIGPA